MRRHLRSRRHHRRQHVLLREGVAGIAMALATPAPDVLVEAVTISFSAAQFSALADPPDLACGDFEAVLAPADW